MILKMNEVIMHCYDFENEWGNYALTVMIFIVVFILLKNEASNKIENLCLDCYNWNSKTSQNIPF